MLKAPRLNGAIEFLTPEGIEAAKAYARGRSISDRYAVKALLWNNQRNSVGNPFHTEDMSLEQRIEIYGKVIVIIPITVGGLPKRPPYDHFARVYIGSPEDIGHRMMHVEHPDQIVAYILARFW